MGNFLSILSSNFRVQHTSFIAGAPRHISYLLRSGTASLLQPFEQTAKEAADKYQVVNLYVNNLDDSIMMISLRSYFLNTVQSHHGRGSGFVGFLTPEETSQAVSDMLTKMTGKMVVNKALYVALAQRKEERSAKLKVPSFYSYEAYMDFGFAHIFISREVTVVVNPAMKKALSILQKYALDAHQGNIVKDKLRFGAPWRHPPCKDDPFLRSEWAKVKLMDFIQLADYPLPSCPSPPITLSFFFSIDTHSTVRLLDGEEESRRKKKSRGKVEFRVTIYLLWVGSSTIHFELRNISVAIVYKYVIM
ncbi:hypothetical protein L2E82_35696 [Cichorium intybus]|uniref:Uncharacterized protein n=1 Tax=Cichorium intybus TaxID=13427 RepID=A0ACB9BPH8_CICIN|nr:hypothetical protein L2E82_35696 [Cichorium intybus]